MVRLMQYTTRFTKPKPRIKQINWLLDVIAPNQKMTASVIASFKQVVKDGDLRLHPIVTKLVDKDVLEKMGTKQIAASDMSTGVRP
jgi:hypothetical protein